MSLSPPSNPLSDVLTTDVEEDACCPGGSEGLKTSTEEAPDFSARAQLIEWMDEPCSYCDLRECLRDIARVNRLTFAHRPTLRWLAKVVKTRAADRGPVRVLDVGCGYGDTLRSIGVWAARRGIAVTLTGIDLNADAIRAAKEATPLRQEIEWKVGDAVCAELNSGADVVICSLLTHHLHDPEIVSFLRWMEETARYGWFVNDLHRQPMPYHLFRFFARWSDWHRFVKHDGPVSIRRSFVAADWRRLCAAAGLDERSVWIETCRPARLCVGRIK